EAGERVRDRGHLRQCWGTVAPCYGDRLQLAGLDVRQRWRHAENADFHLARHHVDNGLAAALVWDVLGREAAQRLDAFEGEVLRPALAGRGERKLARIALGVLDELLQGIRRERRMRDD